MYTTNYVNSAHTHTHTHAISSLALGSEVSKATDPTRSLPPWNIALQAAPCVAVKMSPLPRLSRLVPLFVSLSTRSRLSVLAKCNFALCEKAKYKKLCGKWRKSLRRAGVAERGGQGHGEK